MNTCHDCGAEEGMFHDFGCDMERCPFCGGQLISCDCPSLYFGTEKDLTIEQQDEWEEKCENKGRIPWLAVYPRCPICGGLWNEIWMTADEEWKKYVLPELQKECLCKPCFEKLKKIFPDGWQNAAGYKHPFFGDEA